ncbi:hypothetical protein J4E85_004869 [Alternaria conjuncta]|uniref:uncharacterized protein n=1 Tax=Alternaria conjuncta TaxID=181017 RepID=UPI00221E5338|nr:uncharacterized protein J4E85_004869 [Alternaria conjuncta]KAI4930244.1 hypothetical protein J4E85_004869 [Alternaria conjuncta]
MAALSNAQKEKLKVSSKRSRFYDSSAPGTIAQRAQARSNFQEYCKSVYGIEKEPEMYSRETLIDHVCGFLECMATVSEGVLHDKVKASFIQIPMVGTLYMYKYSLRFWVDRYTLDFESIQTEYYCRVLRHIHMVAVEQDLPTGSREKNELGEFELGLMYMEAMALQEGVLQTKQHYLAWVLAYITGARPGTFTVGTGYHKGAPLGSAMSHTMPTRAVSHTLRWADIKFDKFEQEYCCILTFRFLKGSHDKYKEGNLDGSREFFFAPKQERLHLDLSALLFGEAYTRGLFVDPLDILLSDTSLHFPTIRSEVATQAVFLAPNTECELIPTQEMKANALNRKLQDFCLSVGILCYVSMYSFRRQAAQEAKRDHSTEDAMALLDHAPNHPNTLPYYDQHGFGRRDIITSDPKHKKLEAGLHDILIKAHTKLQEFNLLSPDGEYCITDRNIGKYKALIMGIEEPAFMEIRQELEEHLAPWKFARMAVTQRTNEACRKSIEGKSAERKDGAVCERDGH